MDATQIISVNCNHCGATLEVDEKTRFVTCNYCHSRLAIKRTESSVFTEVLEKIEAQTGQISGNLKVIALQNDLDQLDREWTMSRENLLVNGRNGTSREPSIASGLITILLGVVGGGAMTAIAATHGFPAIFPLFGVACIVISVVNGVNLIAKAGELDSTRIAYEARRRQLLETIEVEKQRQ